MSDKGPTQEGALTFEERTVPLDALYLDPNNARRNELSDASFMPPRRADDAGVQEQMQRTIVGSGKHGVMALLTSLQTLGWIPFERVLVREFRPGKYVVLDGNRRIAVLKYVMKRGQVLPTTPGLKRLNAVLSGGVPVMVVPANDSSEDEIILALRHLSGPRPWSIRARARALFRLHEDRGLSVESLAHIFRLSATAVSDAIRCAQLARQYENYRGPVGMDMFRVLLRVARSEHILTWIGWEEESGQANREDSRERLFDWLAPTFVDEGIEELDERDGEPVRESDVQELNDRLGGTEFRTEETIESILREARIDSQHRRAWAIQDALLTLAEQIEGLSAMSARLDTVHVRRMEELAQQLQQAAAGARDRLPRVVQDAEAWLPPFNASVSAHFSEVTVARYRGLRDVALPSLRRINVVAGLNNSGKTTLLEAVHLLAHQHDVTGALEVVRRRGRVENRVDPRWLVEQIPRTARLSGRFDAISANETAVALDFARRPDVEEAAFYLGTLSLEANYGGRTQRSETLFYENRDRSTRNHGRNVLCRSALQSPFSLQDPSLRGQAYTRSVERLARDRIVSFLREHVDGDLVSIDLVDRFQRFLVSHKGLQAPLDLTHFGDGMQRVFLMCLLVAFVENGVLLLDEFENAIHASLLPGLARFVHELAKEFEVQVFLTTHSDEAIEALVDADLGEAVSAYALVRGDGGITARHFPGTTLAELIDFAGFDLRSVK